MLGVVDNVQVPRTVLTGSIRGILLVSPRWGFRLAGHLWDPHWCYRSEMEAGFLTYHLSVFGYYHYLYQN